ncbi:unnamed protein product [Mytilus coruscus]|uniref:Uncharacterized protein n=1 Tax=Mytilus coruscus TaxID=42192 RepID=A0A6J8A3M2_MYTCO|nr:unnamed protein product [Mytilus coruscus]
MSSDNIPLFNLLDSIDRDVAKASMSGLFFTESKTAYDGASGTSSSIDLSSDDTVLERNTSNVNVPKGMKHRVSFVQPQAREKYKEKHIKEVATELSHEKIHKLVIRSILDGKYKQNIIPIDILNFGGQKDYYMTHQLFITSRGIFVFWRLMVVLIYINTCQI